jgi:hypothetical protein
MKWIDRIPTGPLAAVALFMALSPFAPEPHLLEKFRMLTEGTLTRPADIFDVFWHLSPAALLAAKLLRARRKVL